MDENDPNEQPDIHIHREQLRWYQERTLELCESGDPRPYEWLDNEGIRDHPNLCEIVVDTPDGQGH